MVEASIQTLAIENGAALKAPQKSRNPKECLACRITGTGVLAGTGSYAIWQSRAAAPGSPVQKKIVAGLGLALVVGSVFRWRSWQCEQPCFSLILRIHH